MREPRLRRMRPFTSMLWMSVQPAEGTSCPARGCGVAGDGFAVYATRRAEPRITGDAVEAVRMFLAELDRHGGEAPDGTSAGSETS